MLLSKQLGVSLNNVHYLFKQCFGAQLTKNEIDLTPEQYLVLDLLWDEGPQSQQDIADIMQKDKNSVTKLLDGLAKKGYVIRMNDTEDRRVNRVVVTRAGAKLKRKTTRVAISAVQIMLDGLEDAELVQAVATLNKLGENLKRLGDNLKQERKDNKR